jgi:hypothetical protein
MDTTTEWNKEVVNGNVQLSSENITFGTSPLTHI